MKKVFKIILVALMSMTLVACGNGGNTDTGLKDDTTKSNEVEITIDNWQDYFELEVKDVPMMGMSADGEQFYYDVSTEVYLLNKKDVKLSTNSEYVSKVNVKFSFDVVHKKIVSLDEKTGEYVLGDIIGNVVSGTEEDSVSNEVLEYFKKNQIIEEDLVNHISKYCDSSLLAALELSGTKYDYTDGPSSNTLENVKILDIKGTLYLAE